MAYLIFISVTVALLVGFLALSNYEVRRERRVLARQRIRLDGYVEHAAFILSHVDFGSFAREEMGLIARRIAHNIVHFSLQAVRAVERFLTYIVRYLRSKHSIDIQTHENAREFVKTLSDFKGHLEATRPEVPDIL